MYLIVAVDNENGIGKNNTIPWFISKDLKHFRSITTNVKNKSKINAVVMGRNTWISLPKKLHNRFNIVLSKTEKEIENVDEIHSDLDTIFQLNNNIEKTFIIGGAKLYNTCLQENIIDRIYLTRIYKTFDCDTFLIPIPKSFKIVCTSEIFKENDLKFQFFIYDKYKCF